MFVTMNIFNIYIYIYMLLHLFSSACERCFASVYISACTRQLAEREKAQASDLRLNSIKKKSSPQEIDPTPTCNDGTWGGVRVRENKKTASRLRKIVSNTLVLAESKTSYWPHLLIECACDAFDCKAYIPDTL